LSTFSKAGSNDSQIETDGFVTTPDFKSVLQMAIDAEAGALSMVEANEPPKLPYEDM